MSETRKFFEGIYTVRILSDNPLPQEPGCESLAKLLAETVDGDLVGESIHGSCREISAIHMAEALTQAGSAPEFFNLTDISDVAYELLDSGSQEGCDRDLVVVGSKELNDLADAVGRIRHFNEPNDDTDDAEDDET